MFHLIIDHQNSFSGISFSKEITQRFSTPIERDRRNVFINFGFCVKSIEQQSSSFFLGYSRVDLTDVINASSMFHKKCSIISESDMKVGSVTVKLELGINGLHFGRDLIGEFKSDDLLFSLVICLLCHRFALLSTWECFSLQ